MKIYDTQLLLQQHALKIMWPLSLYVYISVHTFGKAVVVLQYSCTCVPVRFSIDYTVEMLQ